MRDDMNAANIIQLLEISIVDEAANVNIDPKLKSQFDKLDKDGKLKPAMDKVASIIKKNGLPDDCVIDFEASDFSDKSKKTNIFMRLIKSVKGFVLNLLPSSEKPSQLSEGIVSPTVDMNKLSPTDKAAVNKMLKTGKEVGSALSFFGIPFNGMQFVIKLGQYAVAVRRNRSGKMGLAVSWSQESRGRTQGYTVV